MRILLQLMRFCAAVICVENKPFGIDGLQQHYASRRFSRCRRGSQRHRFRQTRSRGDRGIKPKAKLLYWIASDCCFVEWRRRSLIVWLIHQNCHWLSRISKVLLKNNSLMVGKGASPPLALDPTKAGQGKPPFPTTRFRY